ncbi:MAG: UDP-2,3-diacylglucosamine diphosphatase [Endozoicomonas sp. (ex Botrylloides leachii)]|nr:UDP-2,3-diacylglucosamine diphosphatase [Endozoicomonas sp. (ex Botrylloides leachii)]
MQALVISDLHLTPARPTIGRAFLSFMEHTAPKARELYILGDFFEYWVGDDAIEPFHEEIIQSLRRYSDAGHSVFIMAGNRDFAIGEDFLKKAGALWLNDPTLLTLNNEKVLLLHGDLLCTADVQYLRYRRIIRNPWVMKLLRMIPLSYRRKLGSTIRENSVTKKTKKKPEIMDVTAEEVVNMMEHYNVKIMIHGHTHRPAIHDVTLKGNTPAKRIVLGDWGEKGWLLSTDNNQLTLESFDIPDNN